MKKKPVVCVIDEDLEVRAGWANCLEPDATLLAFRDHKELYAAAALDVTLIAELQCTIVGRYFSHLDDLDLVSSDIPQTIRRQGGGPIFLNWQGYITKDELNHSFDGKLFHRYGVKWQTLRLRIQKFEKSQKTKKSSFDTLVVPSHPQPTENKEKISRPERCSELLGIMASNANGPHRSKIEHFASHDRSSGIELLEALYNRLITDKNTPPSCPSRYINSSPVIAKRMLHDALFGSV